MVIEPAAPAVVLVNLGTPAAPTASAVRRFLAEFLSDRRVVELPALIWLPILHGIVLRTRPRRSAEKYVQIWLPEGSPLAVYTARQAELLRMRLATIGRDDIRVEWAMRYGEPQLGRLLDRLHAEGCRHLLILPLYPQYAGSTTGAVFDVVARLMLRWRDQPDLRLIRGFADTPEYIEALAHSVREHWARHGQGERLIISFHGVPVRSIELGDAYARECERTTSALAEALQLRTDEFMLSYQSRFGKARWLGPATIEIARSLAGQGVRRLDVVCPGFVSDCVETLEELDLECRQAFLSAGGAEFHRVPCLNDRPEWIAALAAMVGREWGDDGAA